MLTLETDFLRLNRPVFFKKEVMEMIDIVEGILNYKLVSASYVRPIYVWIMPTI